MRAAGAILEYLVETQKSSLAHIDRLVHYRPGTALEIDEATAAAWKSAARCAMAVARARCWPCSIAR